MKYIVHHKLNRVGLNGLGVHATKALQGINCRNDSVRNNLRSTSMSWEHKKILFVLCIVLHFTLLLLSHHVM